MSAFLSMAKNTDGVLVHVDSVKNGMKCGCFCPECNAPLSARNCGLIREHHFAHAKGMECSNAYETALHLLAKEVILETGCIMLPEQHVDGFPEGLVRLNNVMTEKMDEAWGFIPDAEGIMPNGERLLIEFLVSHKVDDKKRTIIIDHNLKCIELNINSVELNRDRMKEFIMGTAEDRQWIGHVSESNHGRESYSRPRNPLYDKLREYLKDAFDAGTLSISPFSSYRRHWYNDGYGYSQEGKESFCLKQYGYDTCLVGKKHRGIKTDLLLFRRNKGNGNGYIAVCIRGRRRNSGFKYPSGLRVIDIILKDPISPTDFVTLFPKGNISQIESYKAEVICMNFRSERKNMYRTTHDPIIEQNS